METVNITKVLNKYVSNKDISKYTILLSQHEGKCYFVFDLIKRIGKKFIGSSLKIEQEEFFKYRMSAEDFFDENIRGRILEIEKVEEEK